MLLNIELPENLSIEHSGGDGWTILHGDAMRVLPHFQPDSFDALITDPPLCVRRMEPEREKQDYQSEIQQHEQ